MIVVSSSEGDIDKAINNAVGADIAARRARFVKESDDIVAAAQGGGSSVTADQIAQTIRCGDSALTASLVSIDCSSSTSFGGPHPNEQRFAYSFRICRGEKPKPVTLACYVDPERHV